MTPSSTTVKRAWKLPQGGNVTTFGQKVIKNATLTTFEAGNVTTKPAIVKADTRVGAWPANSDGTYKHPETEADIARFLSDPEARVCSGFLYKIMLKAPDATGSSVVPFLPNRAQRRLMARLWHRNIILKARQLGFTTLVAILWLDHALFNADQRVGIIAQDAGAAKIIFRDKVKLAYTRLPDVIKAKFPLSADNADELMFAHNNSSIRVATSMRSGTIHRLHVSEYGKICAKYPEKAAEVATGSLPAVPLDGICIIESTAEGQEGDFYSKTQTAIAITQTGKRLNPKDFRIHFFPWWGEAGYRIAEYVAITDKDREYFDKIEGETGTMLDQEQRNWYVATRDSEFSGDPEKMWQEYPSTSKEAFQVSTEGTYYAVQLASMRKEGRICRVPHAVGVPVNTFWDIGNTDGTAIWFHQRIGFEDRFINFIEGWGESYSYYVQQMQKLGYVWGDHYLPHDAQHKRQGKFSNQSPEDMLKELMPGDSFIIVPRVSEVIHGIQKTRDVFGSMFFDEEKTALGIAHLGNYKKTWDRARGAWKIHTPQKIDGHSEAADALRQFAQGYQAPRLIEGKTKSSRNWRVS